ncbi:autophagy associated protein Aut12 [Schizosaccharomyces japonicus yFS275]|uniref:Vacuolar fusion protein MON1 n=1 Tax=Schizosaccharomyces japonicus (strain yFS275 / FY16936) TaxID=402676 RepID=B6JX75_SCHJY|nr:autophagy associated protein Aut12 [Schizosaccharomyces japonicus yFS275]EEB05976.1 autophagy associated protein Aut12 [Schizosaccharomyces japonicus yFS275]
MSYMPSDDEVNTDVQSLQLQATGRGLVLSHNAHATSQVSDIDVECGTVASLKDPVLQRGVEDIEYMLTKSIHCDLFLEDDCQFSTGSHLKLLSQIEPPFADAERTHFIISPAGKPIFESHSEEESRYVISGALQAIVSSFDCWNEELHSFTSNEQRITVMKRDPLFFVCIETKARLSQRMITHELSFLYSHLSSILLAKSIEHAFTQRPGYDLQRALGNATVFLSAAAEDVHCFDPSSILTAVPCLPVPHSFRERLAALLLKTKSDELLFAMIAINGKIISAIRPKSYAWHPADVCLLLSAVYHTTAFKDSAEHWLPICLPHFCKTGYAYAYVHYLDDSISLVLTSTDPTAFFELQQMKMKMLKELNLEKEIYQKLHEYESLSSSLTCHVGFPVILHFAVYSKELSQLYFPGYVCEHVTQEARRLYAIYAELYDRSMDQQQPFLLLMDETTPIIKITWSTATMQFFCIANSISDRGLIFATMRRIYKWVKLKKKDIFLVESPTF